MRRRPWRDLFGRDSVFSVASPAHGSWDDRHIMSMSIDRGSTMSGLSTSTATIDVKRDLPAAPASDQGIRIDLTSLGRDRIASLTGILPARIERRFTGRIAGQSVTDRGDAPRSTSLTLQDWPALISQLDRGATVTRDEDNVWRAYISLLGRSQIPGQSTLQPWGENWPLVRFTPEEIEAGATGKVLSTADVLGKYSADVGILIRQERAGRMYAWSHDHICDLAGDWRQYNPHPLQRLQVLSPAHWVQPITVPIALTWDQWTYVGSPTLVTQTVTVGNSDFVTKGEHVDLTHLWPVGEGEFRPAMTARANAAAGQRYRVESVTIDLLHLLRSPHDRDRHQAGQILTLEHGNPISLSHDWPDDVAGIYFVERISERITPDGWTAELSLVPETHVTGKPATPDIRGDTWDTAYTPPTTWHGPSTAWENSP